MSCSLLSLRLPPEPFDFAFDIELDEEEVLLLLELAAVPF